MKQLSLYSLLVFTFFSLALRADTSVSPPPDARFKVDLLVVVAHPDDETEIGPYLARAIFDEKKRVAVVFGTRGNSGGNAEGQEQGGSLASIREIEARKALAHFGVMDVWFLNGLDTPGQDVLDSLETWNHGDSLDRVVRLARLTRPSVIATWLPDWVAGENHGDHQAAGVIATEAFDMAADPTAFAEQLAPPRNREDINNLTEGLRPWQPEKIYYFSDAEDTAFMKGKGPEYSSADVSPSRKVSYGRLGAEEYAFHLTQDGQIAKNAIAKNDLAAFEKPVRLIFGKSYVKSSVTGDLFEGVEPAGIPFERAPGYAPPHFTSPVVELGDPWRFYRQFWQAHGLNDLAGLLSPEVMAKYSAPFIFPLVIENPTGAAISVDLSAALPVGWSFRRQLPSNISVPALQSSRVAFETRTPSAETKGWQTVSIDATANGQKLPPIRIRVELRGGAMPQ